MNEHGIFLIPRASFCNFSLLFWEEGEGLICHPSTHALHCFLRVPSPRHVNQFEFPALSVLKQWRVITENQKGFIILEYKYHIVLREFFPLLFSGFILTFFPKTFVLATAHV